MSLMRLSDTVDNVDFDPMEGYVDPMEREVTNNKTLDGSLYTYKWSQKGRWEIPVNMESDDRDIIYPWWEDITELYFYPDYENYPATKYIVRIINDDNPLPRVFPSWNGQYEGTLILREV